MSSLLVALLLASQSPATGTPAPASPPPLSPQGPANGTSNGQPARPDGAPARRWQNLNAVDLIVNGDCITRSEVSRMVDASPTRKAVTTPQERQQRRMEVNVAQVRRLLQVQGGKDLGYDQKMIDSFIKDRFVRDLERTGSISLLADQLALEDTGSAEYKRVREERTFEQLWAMSSIGRFAGAGGRPYVDRFVRPGRLGLEFKRQGSRLDVPATLVLRDLLLPPRQGEELEATARRANALRTRIAAGEDFLEAGRAAGAVELEKDGLVQLKEGDVLKRMPDLETFLKSAKPGDLTEVLPYAPEGELRAFRILRFEERREGKTARFDEQELQNDITRGRQRAMDEHRLEVAIGRLLEAAYVWPPEAFGRAKTPAAPPSPEAKSGAE